MPAHVGSQDIVPLILNLGFRWRCLVTITSQTLHPFDAPQYALNMKLGGPQRQAGYYIEAGWAPETGWILYRSWAGPRDRLDII
jgi:hypothetical protein